MSGEPWSEINEEGQAYLGRKEDQRCKELLERAMTPTDKYAERARETDLAHDLVPVGEDGEPYVCACCRGRYISKDEALISGWCPVLFARALEQAALETRIEVQEDALSHGGYVSQTKLGQDRARLAELRPEQEGKG